MRDDLVEEELRRQPLAGQPSLHVGKGEQHRVDRLRLDRDPQFLQRQEAAPLSTVRAHQVDSSSSIAASSAAVPCTFGPVNQLRADTSQ